MKYIITKQIAVEAESPEDAVAKMATGKTISFSVQERPQLPIVQPPTIQPQPQVQAPITIGKPVLTPTPANP